MAHVAGELAGTRVLLVEDDILIAMDMEDLLTGLGCTVIGPFARVEQALAAARNEQLDGALLDLNLQGELSFPIVEELQRRGIPLIVSSGYVELPQLKERLEGIPTIGKPCDQKKLAGMMAERFVARSAAHTSGSKGSALPGPA